MTLRHETTYYYRFVIDSTTFSVVEELDITENLADAGARKVELWDRIKSLYDGESINEDSPTHMLIYLSVVVEGDGKVRIE